MDAVAPCIGWRACCSPSARGAARVISGGTSAGPDAARTPRDVISIEIATTSGERA